MTHFQNISPINSHGCEENCSQLTEIGRRWCGKILIEKFFRTGDGVFYFHPRKSGDLEMLNILLKFFHSIINFPGKKFMFPENLLIVFIADWPSRRENISIISIFSLIVLYMLRIHINYPNQLKKSPFPCFILGMWFGKCTFLFVWKMLSINFDHTYLPFFKELWRVIICKTSWLTTIFRMSSLGN